MIFLDIFVWQRNHCGIVVVVFLHARHCDRLLSTFLLMALYQFLPLVSRRVFVNKWREPYQWSKFSKIILKISQIWNVGLELNIFGLFKIEQCFRTVEYMQVSLKGSNVICICRSPILLLQCFCIEFGLGYLEI